VKLLCVCDILGNIYRKETTRNKNNWKKKVAVDAGCKVTAFAPSPTREDVFYVGTKRGAVLSTEFLDAPMCPPADFFGVQNLLVLDDGDGERVFATYIKGVVVEFGVEAASGDHLAPTVRETGIDAVVNCMTKATESVLVGGDSRGNIFVWGGDCGATSPLQVQVPPLQTLKNVHKRDHVRDIIYSSSSSMILSAGHDGNIAIFSFDRDSETITLVNRRNLSNIMSVIDSIFISDDHSLVATGYKSSSFVVWDVDVGYEIGNFKSKGGWKKVHAFRRHGKSFEFAESDSDSKKRDPNVTQYFGKEPSFGRSFGTNFHGSTTHCVTAFRRREGGEEGEKGEGEGEGEIVVFTGGEDCLAKLSVARPHGLSVVQEVAQGESSVRDCCFCHSNSHSNSSLLVTVGGKLEVGLYRFEHSKCLAYKLPNQLRKKRAKSWKEKDAESMDHRMNAVCALEMKMEMKMEMEMESSSASTSPHLVVTGDSDGVLCFLRVDLFEGFSEKWAEDMQVMEGRPILSADITERVLAVGNTAGEIGLFAVPRGDDVNFNFRLIHRFSPHQCGTNCLQIVTEGVDRKGSEDVNSSFLVVSGGDDQAIALFRGNLRENSNQFVDLESSSLVVKPEASGSAIKGIHMDVERQDIKIVGYEQRIETYYFNDELDIRRGGNNGESIIISNVSDMSGMAVVGGWTCCVGDGIELFNSYSKGKNTVVSLVAAAAARAIQAAARAIQEADHVLVLAGAGASADSGLKTYENLSEEEYRNWCDTKRLIESDESREEFQRRWKEFGRNYRNAVHHDGYGIMRRWCEGKNYFVYTSNVDGLFARAGFEEQRIHEIHGNGTNDWVCGSNIGFKRRGFDSWNQKFLGCCKSQSSVGQGQSKGRGVNNDSTAVICACGCPLRPPVLMFSDEDPTITSVLKNQSDNYQKWESIMSNCVVERKERLVILEVGCGKLVPCVRHEGYEVARDILKRDHDANVKIIRINMNGHQNHLKGVDLEWGVECGSGSGDKDGRIPGVVDVLTSIEGRALDILKKLDEHRMTSEEEEDKDKR